MMPGPINIKKEGWSDRSGNFGYPSLGDTGVAVLQGRDKMSSATTENLLLTVAVIIKSVASSVQPLIFTGRQILFKYADVIYRVAVQYTAFE